MKDAKVLMGVTILSLLLFASCASVAKIPITRPAEINLTGIKRIAIGNIEGNTGDDLSDLLSQKLFESGHFEVLDRQNIDALMREHNLNWSGIVDEKTSVKIGGFLGVSALIFGKSNGQYRQTAEIGQSYNCSKYKVCRDYKKIAKGTINTTLRVVDLKTGKIIAVKNYTDEDSHSVWEANEWPADLDRKKVMGQILNTTANRFMKMIAPYVEYVSVEFEDSKIPEVKAGIVAAQSGQWDSACVQFKNAVDANPNDAAAWFNLGLAYMYTYRFDEAIQALNRSNTLNPSSKCAQEISNCNRLRDDKKKMDTQMEGRSG